MSRTWIAWAMAFLLAAAAGRSDAIMSRDYGMARHMHAIALKHRQYEPPAKWKHDERAWVAQATNAQRSMQLAATGAVLLLLLSAKKTCSDRRWYGPQSEGHPLPEEHCGITRASPPQPAPSTAETQQTVLADLVDEEAGIASAYPIDTLAAFGLELSQEDAAVNGMKTGSVIFSPQSLRQTWLRN